MVKKTKPNCYECIHKGNVPGSAHSSCKHPSNDAVTNDPAAQMMDIFASVGRVATVQVDTGLNVKGNPTGIKRGWFNWPLNFDPVWLERCDGFTADNGEQGSITYFYLAVVAILVVVVGGVYQYIGSF